MIIKGIYSPAGKNQWVDLIDLGRAINRECEFPRLDRLATVSILDPDGQWGRSQCPIGRPAQEPIFPG